MISIFTCGMLGHKEKDCDSGRTDQDHQYGIWLRAGSLNKNSLTVNIKRSSSSGLGIRDKKRN